mmetsp:Transcript_16926/g.43129  ORF Transcript_16926/g.43129 Transcript_16926/m.43129 type:complete len:267 (+) Transcript_16926:903-1703(+)
MWPLQPMKARIHFHENGASRREHDLCVARPILEPHGVEHAEGIVCEHILHLTTRRQEPVPFAYNAMRIPSHALPLGVHPDSHAQMFPFVRHCVYNVLCSCQELLQRELAINQPVGVFLADKLTVCSFNIVKTLAEEDAVAPRAPGRLRHQGPAPVRAGPGQELGQAPGPDLLGGGHPAFAEPLLHLGLVLPRPREARGVAGHQPEGLGQLVRQLDSWLRAAEHCHDVIGKAPQIRDKLRHVLEVNGLREVWLILLVGVQKECSELE